VSLVLIQLQSPFGGQQQWLQGTRQLRLALKEAIDHHFVVAAGQDATQLASATVALFGKIAFCIKPVQV
jgi:hypothetical protein